MWSTKRTTPPLSGKGTAATNRSMSLPRHGRNATGTSEGGRRNHNYNGHQTKQKDNSVSSTDPNSSSGPPSVNNGIRRRRRQRDSDLVLLQNRVAMSREETILLSATGDVLVCRCRESSWPYNKPNSKYQKSRSNVWFEKEESKNKNSNGEIVAISDNSATIKTLCPCNVYDTDELVGRTTDGLCIRGGTASHDDSIDNSKDHNGYQSRTETPYRETGGLLGGAEEAMVRVETNDNYTTTNLQTINGNHHKTNVNGGRGNSECDNDTTQQQISTAVSTEITDQIHNNPLFHDGTGSVLLNQQSYDSWESSPSLSSVPSFDNSVCTYGTAGTARTNMTAATREPEVYPEPESYPKKTAKSKSMDTSSSTQENNRRNKESSKQQQVKAKKNYNLSIPVMHGIPTFLKSLSQIRITQVSAHPLGSHVLLISEEALLLSYGLNDHGQLGNGKKTSKFSKNGGYVTRPAIVTAVLENGGKAVTCAAGVDHSLVVIKTEGKRIGRLHDRKKKQQMSSNHSRNSDKGSRSSSTTKMRSSNPSKTSPSNNSRQRGSSLPRTSSSPCLANDEETSDTIMVTTSSGSNDEAMTKDEVMSHHQLYGFGSNEYNKLGLVNAKKNVDEDDDVLKPKRVALHCRVWPTTTTTVTKEADTTNISDDEEGIFSIAASLHHSAALVRRATGAVQVYTWGKASDGALGISTMDYNRNADGKNSSKSLGKNSKTNLVNGSRHNQLPSSEEVSSARSFCLSQIDNVETPTLVGSLSYTPSYSSSSNGDCTKKVGNKKGESSSTPKDNLLLYPCDNEYPTQIALGPSCTFVVTSSGRCLSFGTSEDGLLGHGQGITVAYEPTATSVTREQQQGIYNHNRASELKNKIVSMSIGARNAVALTKDGCVYSWGSSSFGRLGFLKGDSKLKASSSCFPKQTPKNEIKVTKTSIEDNNKNDISKSGTSNSNDICWEPQRIQLQSIQNFINHLNEKKNALTAPLSPTESEAGTVEQHKQQIDNSVCCGGKESAVRIDIACAGYDSTVLVTDTGRVLSCGKQSGRLGLGEVETNVIETPRPMFGDLHLWRQMNSKKNW